MKKQDKKIKFSISVDPKIYNIMDVNMVNKSRLIEFLLKKYYNDNKDMQKM
jgi:hypothetical protein